MHHNLELPSHLYGNYMRHKHETDEIAAWLARNADKARRSLGFHAECPRTSRIAVDRFVTLAQEIASSPDPNLHVPTATIELIRSVLRSRQDCSKWFTSNARTSFDLRSNKSHGHFIDILEKVLEILLPLQRRAPLTHQFEHQPCRRKGAHVKAREVDERTWAQETEDWALEMEKSQADSPQITPLPGKSTLKTEEASARFRQQKVQLVDDRSKSMLESGPVEDEEPVREYEAEMGSDPEDLLFQCFCILDDYNKVRAFVAEEWRMYRSGKSSLIEAAQVTNTALDITRRLHSDFDRAVGEKSTYHAIFVDFLYRIACRSRGIPFEDHSHIATSDAQLIEPEMQQMLDWMFFQTSQVVTSNLRFLELVPTSTITSLSEQLLAFQTTVKREWVHDDERGGREARLLQDNEIVEELFCSGMACLVPTHDLPVDNYLQALCCAATCKCIRSAAGILWLSLATQIMIDIQRILGNHDLATAATEPFRLIREFKINTTKHMTLIRSYAEKGPEISGWAEKICEILQERLDRVAKVQQLISKPGRKHFYARSPLAAGLLCFELRYQMHIVGTGSCDALGDVLVASHTYNAARQEDPLTLTWPDMDHIISIHTPEYLFAGGFPTSCCNYYARWLLVEGLSTSGHNNRRRSMKFRKFAANTLPLCTQLYKMNLTMSSKQRDSFTEELDLIIAVVSSDNQGRRRIHQFDDGTINVVELRKFVKNAPKLKPVELLEWLAICLKQEIPELHFDYAGLAERCHELDAKFAEVMDGKIAQMAVQSNQFNLSLESGLPRVLADLERLHTNPAVRCSRRLQEAALIPLVTFVEVLNVFVQEHGSVGVDALERNVPEFVFRPIEFKRDVSKLSKQASVTEEVSVEIKTEEGKMELSQQDKMKMLELVKGEGLGLRKGE